MHIANVQLAQIVTLLALLAVSGWFTSAFTQLIKRESWPSSLKLGLTAVVSVVVAVAALWLTGSVTHIVEIWKTGTITATELWTFGALVFASAQVWYHAVLKTSGWAATLAAWPHKT